MPRFEPLEGDLILNDRTDAQIENLIRRVTDADRVLSSLQTRLDAIGASGVLPAGGAGVDQYERLQKVLDAISVDKLGALSAALENLSQMPQTFSADPITGVTTALDAAAESAQRHAQAAAGAAAAQRLLNEEMARAGTSGGAATFRPERMLLNEDADLYSTEKAPDAGGIAQAATATSTLAAAQIEQSDAAQKAAASQDTLNEEIKRATELQAQAAQQARQSADDDQGKWDKDAGGFVKISFRPQPAGDAEEPARPRVEELSPTYEAPAASVEPEPVLRPAQSAPQPAVMSDASESNIERMVKGIIQGLSGGALETLMNKPFVQQNPVVGAGMQTMQAGQFAGMVGTAMNSSAIAGLSTIATGAGAAVVGVGALVAGFNALNDAVADTERRSLAIDKLSEKFGDVGEVVEATQEAIRGAADERTIERMMGAISETSVLTDLENFSNLAEVAQRKAYQMGTSWEQAMGAISEAVQAGNGDALKELGLVDNPTRTLLEYADSVGKLVPQLSEWEIQQALLNEVMREGSELIAAPMSEAEQMVAAYDSLGAGISDATTAFTDWVISLVSPDAQSAASWWAEQLNKIGAAAQGAAEGLQRATDENRARQVAQETGQEDAYNTLLDRRTSAQSGYQNELGERGLTNLLGEQLMPDEDILKQFPELQDAFNARSNANAAVDAAIEKLLNGGDITQDPSVKLAEAQQRLQEISRLIDELSRKTPEQVVNDAEMDVSSKDAIAEELQRIDPWSGNTVGTPEQIAAADRDAQEANLALSVVNQTGDAAIQAQLDALVNEREQIERGIADLERAAMTPAQRLEEDKQRLQEILADIEDTQRRIAENSAKLRYMPAGANVQGQIENDQERLRLLELDRSTLASRPDIAASIKTDQAMQDTGTMDAYNRLLAERDARQNQGQSGGAAQIDQVAQELAASSAQLMEAQQGLLNAAQSGSQEQIVEAQGAMELAAARQNAAVAAANLTEATIALNEARKSGDADAVAEAQATLQTAQAQQEGAAAAQRAVMSKVSMTEASRAVAEAEAQYNAALAGGVPSIVAAAEAHLRAAQSKLASAIASEGMLAAETSVVSIAGQMFDAVSGLPVAFDAAALGTEGLNLALDQVKLKMQEVMMQAGQMAMSIGYNLMPYIGVDAGLSKGKEYAGNIQTLNNIMQPAIEAGELSPDMQQSILAAGNAINQQDAAQYMSSTGGAASSATKNVEALNDALEGLARVELKDTTKGLLDLDSILGREDEIDEKARRMADVAVKGFESPWFDGLKDMFPADVLEKGADAVKQYAAQMVRDHQNGLTNVFYDTEMAADNVIDKINAKMNQDQLVAEVRDKVKEKLGGEDAAVSDEDIMKALGIDTSEQAMSGAVQKMTMSFDQFATQLDEALNGEDGGAGKSAIEKMTKLTEDSAGGVKKNAEETATTMGEAFVNQVTDGAYGEKAIVEIKTKIGEKKTDIINAGKEAGGWWGGGFLDEVKKNTPPGLLELLVSKLVPLMQQAQAEEGERNGTTPV